MLLKWEFLLAEERLEFGVVKCCFDAMAKKLLNLFKQRLNTRAFFKRSQTETDLNSSLVETGQRDRRTEEQRETWTNRWEYYLSCLGYAIGLGNVWRFPYLAYSLGGGAFVIAYFTVLIFVGIPLVLLELAIGQYTGLGPAVAFQKLCPIFGGLGVAIVVNQFLICTYYSMVVAWTLFYLFASLRGDVPWSHCGPALSSSSLCFSDQDFQACNRLGGVYNQLCFTKEFAQYTGTEVVPASLRVSSAEDYLNQYVLRLSSSISESGPPDWRLALCLALSWLICFLCLIQGIRSSGKVVWFTTIFPMVCLLIFAIRGATLDNAVMGIRYFIVPDWNQLASLTVWIQAAAQVFFNLSVGGGGLITYASYSRFSHNFYFDAVSLSLLNGLTSLLAGFAVFSTIGFMAGQLGLPVSRVVREGPGLVFAIFPDAITRMPVPTFWAILFNLMLLCLGLDTQFAIIETVVTGITDLWPEVRNRKRLIILAVCCAAFLIGLLFTTKAGLYWVRLFDYFVASWPLILFAFCEIAVVLIYGVPRFTRNITEMIGRNVSWFYKILWYTVVPLSTLFLVLASWATHQPLDYNGMIFPSWAQAVGWLLAVLPVLLIPAYALYHVLAEVEDTQQSFMKVLRASLISPKADIRRGAKSDVESPGSALASPRRIPPVSSITGRRMPNESELVPALTVISRAQGPLNIDFRETHV